MLELFQVNRAYGAKDSAVFALRDVSLTIAEGEMLVVLGQSGSGKSTLLNVISGLDSPTAGEMRYLGADMTGFSEAQLETYRRDEVGFIFQTYNLIPNLTVKENIELGAQLSQAKEADIVERLMAEFELTAYRDWFPYQLSGGGKQRIAIARALAKKPRLLVCDEPTGALDEANATKVMQQLQSYNAQYGTTIVVITHNPAYARAGHRAIYLHNGTISHEVRNPQPTPAAELHFGSWLQTGGARA
jgi:putative ABC transport system ATP-binding protein